MPMSCGRSRVAVGLSAFVLQVFRVSSQHHPLGHERKPVLGHAIDGHPIAGSRGHGSGDIDLPERWARLPDERTLHPGQARSWSSQCRKMVSVLLWLPLRPGDSKKSDRLSMTMACSGHILQLIVFRLDLSLIRSLLNRCRSRMGNVTQSRP